MRLVSSKITSGRLRYDHHFVNQQHATLESSGTEEIVATAAALLPPRRPPARQRTSSMRRLSREMALRGRAPSMWAPARSHDGGAVKREERVLLVGKLTTPAQYSCSIHGCVGAVCPVTRKKKQGSIKPPAMNSSRKRLGAGGPGHGARGGLACHELLQHRSAAGGRHGSLGRWRIGRACTHRTGHVHTNDADKQRGSMSAGGTAAEAFARCRISALFFLSPHNTADS